jgi:hypothetical protein
MNINKTLEQTIKLVQHNVEINDDSYIYTEMYTVDDKLISYTLYDYDRKVPLYKDEIIDMIHDWLNFEMSTLQSIKDKDEHKPTEVVIN